MFKWYMNSFLCIAYLHDVESAEGTAIEKSRWFKRGWTLQELLAPHVVVFLNRDWQTIGHKRYSTPNRIPNELWCGPDLNERLARTTGIPVDVLSNYESSAAISVDEKRSWLNDRATTRKEDMAYCMLGILGVSMTAIYGEGTSRSWKRLERELRGQETGTDISSSDNEAPYMKLLGTIPIVDLCWLDNY